MGQSLLALLADGFEALSAEALQPVSLAAMATEAVYLQQLLAPPAALLPRHLPLLTAGGACLVGNACQAGAFTAP